MTTTNEQIKNLTPEQKEAIVKEVNTELASVAQEELRTGKQIVLPSAEEMVAKAGASIIQAQKILGGLLMSMSKKQVLRALHAIFAPPQADMPVYLKDDKEKMLFDLGQKVFMSKHIIFEHHVLQERLRIKEELKKQAEAKAQQEATNNNSNKEENNESAT